MSGDGPPQLRIDGGEDTSRRASKYPQTTTAQQRILHKISTDGQIRAVEAGVMVHEARGKRCCLTGAAGADRHKGGGIGCCAYASADGNSALKRLEKRGLVKRGERVGVWIEA